MGVGTPRSASWAHRLPRRDSSALPRRHAYWCRGPQGPERTGCHTMAPLPRGGDKSCAVPATATWRARLRFRPGALAPRTGLDQHAEMGLEWSSGSTGSVILPRDHFDVGGEGRTERRAGGGRPCSPGPAQAQTRLPWRGSREPRLVTPPRLGLRGTQLSLFTPSNCNFKCLQVSLHSALKKIKIQTVETKPENQKSKG